MLLMKDPSFLSRLCHQRICLEIHSPSIRNLVPKLMDTFLWFGDAVLLESAVQTVVLDSRQRQDQAFLRGILEDDKLWRKGKLSSPGRKAARVLAEERIRWLANTPEPKFSWCQPGAQLLQYPAVEAFLRGPLESLNHGVRSLPEARRMAQTYFTGSYRDGYSAIGVEGGRGVGAFCSIRKTRAAFDKALELWNTEQRELVKLRSRLQGVLEPLEVDEAVVAKRMRSDHGPNDLTSSVPDAQS